MVMEFPQLAPYLQELPAGAIADTVNRQLETHSRLVVTAPPGAGKSTLLPLTLLQGTEAGKVVVLEPRRLAARQIAERMAAMLGEPVGKTVGYRVRFESKVSKDTRIEVLTEGILTRLLVDDATLDGVSVVVFDEFHERSLNSDVALALTREAQDLLRPDLRIVVMSATIDAAALCRALDAPLVESEGRMFPVDIRYGEEADVQHCAEQVARAISRAHREHEGDILAFLPGQAEILKCQDLLGDALGATRVCSLYGLLPPQEQRRAIAPSPPGSRKVVLATPVAETSLTIEGVRIVIDAGFCRTMAVDARTGLSRMETVRISMDMARQRSGRAGRVAAGICYRLWSKATEQRMADCRQPEILEADLAPTLLDIAAWGGGEVEQLPWLTPPPKAQVAQARQLLRWLGALDEAGHITPHGRRLAALPCHPRMAQMMLKAETPGRKALAADIAALLEEKDPLLADNDADIRSRLVGLQEARRKGAAGRWNRIVVIAAQYRRMMKVGADIAWNDVHAAGALMAAAYPERVAQRAGHATYKLAGGGTLVRLAEADALSAYDLLAVASLGTRIFLAAPLEEAEVSELVMEKNALFWDSKEGRVVARSERRIGTLLLGSRPLSQVDSEKRVQVICDAVRKEGLSLLDINDEVQRLQRRIAAVAVWHPELELPDLSTEAVLSRTEEWLPFYLGKASTAAELKKINLCEAVWNLLAYEQQVEIDRLAPSHLQVPTGSRIRVDYRQGAEAPVVCVRLQECFGLTDTPRVDDGRRPVLMELLSPGFKPVQLTQDLRSFWSTTYFEVRKELRRRYPKHYWPDNPLEAEAVRGVKRK